jgi:hypothetical protein
MKGNVQFITKEVTIGGGGGYEHRSKCSSEVTWHFVASYQLPKHVIMKELSQQLSEYE